METIAIGFNLETALFFILVILVLVVLFGAILWLLAEFIKGGG